MGKVKRKNGISLIVLVITILVMIILAGVVVVTMSENNPINKAKEANFKSDIATFQEDLSMHIANKLAMDSSVKVTDIDAKGYDAIKKVVNSFTKKYENKIEVVDGKIVYVGTDKDELAWAGGAGVTSKAGMVNAPVLSSGMIPVKYNGTKWEICDSKDPSWYNYENKQWANVMLSDGKYKAATPGTVVEDADLGSMFVWIPRFAYSINKYKTAAAGAEGQTQNIHDISFLTGKTNSDVDGKVYGKSYDAKNAEVGKATPKIVHPAFNFGGEEKQGIWVAKFEASMNEDGTGHTNQNTNASCNFVADNSIKVLPGKVTWRYTNIDKMFFNCLNMIKSNNVYGITNVNSHLMKNIEWGAVAYLSTSKYGSTPTTATNIEFVQGQYNGAKYYAGGGVNKYRANKSQSTTGNETGIYDMNGGSWEYVAAYGDNNHEVLSKYGGTTLFNANTLNDSYKKYFDVYQVSEKEKDITKHKEMWNASFDNPVYGNSFRKDVLSKERYNLLSTHIGDAMYEVTKENIYTYYGKFNNNTYGWLKDLTGTVASFNTTLNNNDFCLIGNLELTFFSRGADGNALGYAGVFSYGGGYGGADSTSGFRPVIVNN